MARDIHDDRIKDEEYTAQPTPLVSVHPATAKRRDASRIATADIQSAWLETVLVLVVARYIELCRRAVVDPS